jgi:thiamine kinase-like enzyme
MENLGRLHAVAFAFKNKHPKEHEQIKNFTDFFSAQIDDPRFQFFFTSLLDQAIGTLEEGDIRRRNKMQNLKANVASILKEVTNGKLAEPYAILNHGDCWTNNFLFQYQVRSK